MVNDRYRLPNELYTQPGIRGQKLNNIWRGEMFEYWKNSNPIYHPHVVILSRQSTPGHNGSILYGELLQLVTAMRNRAHQRVVIEDDLEEWELYCDTSGEAPKRPPDTFFNHPACARA